VNAPLDRRPSAPKAAVSAAALARKKAIFGSGGLYQPRQPIHPKLVHGRWRQIKWALLIVTLAIYYGAPWLRWTRPESMPQQAILVDFSHGRFYFFGLHLWPQEVFYITGLLILAALALFLVTAMFGRLWCGYACPQTIWTDIFILVERAFEGDRNARLKLAAAPWNAAKVGRKVGKHAVWLMIAFWTGGAWNLYFHDAPSLLRDFWTGSAAMTVYLSFAILTATTYSLAGLMREQVCTYMCPWPRIQGAMIDRDTLQVTYRYDRGEPRGAHKKADSWANRGDCVDCQQCVVVCPMGIDIRNGAQFECINCGLCADACDEVMVKVGRPKGLIAYDTDAAVLARSDRVAPRYRIVRPRTVLYTAALTVVSALMIYGLAARDPMVFSVLRDRNPTHVTMRDGSVRDGYTLRISNRTLKARDVLVGIEGLATAKLHAPGEEGSTSTLQIRVPADASRSVKLFVTAPVDELRAAIIPIDFVLASDADTVREASTFVSGEVR